MFYSINGEIFNSILRVEYGEWLIAYENPSAPMFVSDDVLCSYEKIEVPKEYLLNIESNGIMSAARNKRYKMISPLLASEKYIIDKAARNRMVNEIATEHKTTKRRVARLFYRYLAKRILIETNIKPNRKNEKYRIYEKTIHKYYYSAKKHSLHATYEMMLLENYMDSEGNLKEDFPTWNSFRHFFYDNNFNKSAQKSISRDGLGHYQRDERPLFGTAMHWKQETGHYQMDATMADIYLVSRFDSSVIIGRPYIYTAVDTSTQLICGVYVGLDCDDSAVMACIANAAANKVEYCKRYEIDITEEQWPSKGLPSVIITDNGNDFTSTRIEELCTKYGVEIESLPPFRPDWKSLVEKSFDMIQRRYKPHLRGNGIIEPDAQERWAMDYRAQATLNLTDFTKVVINCIVSINSGRILENYVPSAELLRDNVPLVPAKLWEWFEQNRRSKIIPVNQQDIYLMSLGRKETKINRMGIKYKGFWYQYPGISQLLKEIGTNKKVKIAYDNNNISTIYLIHKTEYIPFTLPEDYSDYLNLCTLEIDTVHASLKKQKKEFQYEETLSRVNLIRQINGIVEPVKAEPKLKQKGHKIKINREIEKGKLT